jgi:hypothetical protein
LSKLGAASTITVEPGKTYYFELLVEERKEFPYAVALKRLDDAEGQFLISSHSLGSPKAKKAAGAKTDSDDPVYAH